MGIVNRLVHAWNAFTQTENRDYPYNTLRYTGGTVGYVSSVKPDRFLYTRGNERSIATSVFNRISMDCASVKIRHVRLDKDERYVGEIDSGLNYCFKYRPNKDQTSRSFVQDIVASMLDEGVVAVVPVDTDTSTDLQPFTSYDIETMRVGKILKWYPDAVEVEVYNDRKGIKENIMMLKRNVAIIENPLYSVINAPNSTLQRLIRKLNMLDIIDEQTSSGKLDLIIQLPYIIKTEARKQQAEQRRQDIEDQLSGSKYGIAYTDGTEKITQLNRPVENNLMKQVEYLTNLFYSQIGITQEILNGTAKPEEMTNYMNRTVEPILSAIVDEMTTKFLTKTAITQGHSIRYFNNPFRLIPIDKIADIADKFTRNEIISSNEMRQIIGMKPVDDARADELRNKNLNASENQEFASTNTNASQEQNAGEQQSVGDTNISDLMDT